MRLIPNEHLIKLKRRDEFKEGKEMMEKRVDSMNPEGEEREKEEEQSNRKRRKEKITNFPQEFNEI